MELLLILKKLLPVTLKLMVFLPRFSSLGNLIILKMSQVKCLLAKEIIRAVVVCGRGSLALIL